MDKCRDFLMPKALLAAAVSVLAVPASDAAVVELEWAGNFTMLNRLGSALMNSSIGSKVANQYQTPISGTLALDTQLGAGTMTIAPFDWQSQPADLPAHLHDVEFELIGDGFGGAGTLALGNMLYDWNGNRDLSVSIVWDMAGLLGAVADGVAPGDSIIGVGALPSSDGTLTPYNGFTYLNQGPAPVATTNFNTTSVEGCVLLDCVGLMPSGVLPLLADNQYNEAKSTETESVYGVGGSPVWDGPWNEKNFNIDLVQLNVTGVTPVPLPGAFWLLGTGLAAVLGAGRVKRGRRSVRAGQPRARNT